MINRPFRAGANISIQGENYRLEICPSGVIGHPDGVSADDEAKRALNFDCHKCK